MRSEDHSTDVEGLYAIVEASSGLHGANRLGGNSLIELLVYGKIVGQAAARYSAELGAQQRSRTAVFVARDEIDQVLSAGGPENVRSLQRALRNTMTEHAGVVRDAAGLRTGLNELADIEDHVNSIGVHPVSPGITISLTQSTSRPAPLRPGRPLRRLWRGARPADVTTGPTTRISTRNSTSIWCGQDPARSNVKPSGPYRLTSLPECARCPVTASLSNNDACAPTDNRRRPRRRLKG